MIENYTVLVIDDEDIVRESLVAYLEDSGFNIIEASDGQSGLKLFKTSQQIRTYVLNLHQM